MLKSVSNCINAMVSGKDKFKTGNHRAERYSDGTIAYYYHDTAVCVVSRGRVEYNNGGWDTFSTSRTLSSYAEYYGGDRKKQVNK